MRSRGLTYGEAWFIRKESLDFSLSISKMASQFEKPLPQRMTRYKAMQYYKTKLRNVFGVPDVDFVSRYAPDGYNNVGEMYDEAYAMRKKSELGLVA